MDADEMLHVDENFDWSILDDTSVQSYNICAQNEGLKYFRTWFWNAKLSWFFAHDKRHETIHLPEIGENFQRNTMPYGFRHLVSQDGNTWFVPRKFLKDALELEMDKVVGDKVLEDYYHLWYIAKSYADCYGDHTQYAFGRRHSEEFARRSLFYYERFLALTHDWDNSRYAKREDEMGYFALITMAHAYGYLNDYENAIEHFNLATDFCPDRNEHYMYLAQYLESQGKNEEALVVVEKMMEPGRNNPFPNRSFLIEDRCYLNTSNNLNELKEKLIRKNTEHVIDGESFTFTFE